MAIAGAGAGFFVVLLAFFLYRRRSRRAAAAKKEGKENASSKKEPLLDEENPAAPALISNPTSAELAATAAAAPLASSSLIASMELKKAPSPEKSGLPAASAPAAPKATPKAPTKLEMRNAWQEAYDFQTRAKYWVNMITGEFSWKDPNAPVATAEPTVFNSLRSQAGRATQVFSSTANRATVTKKNDEEEEDEWEEVYDADSDSTYFMHSKTGEVSRKDPRLGINGINIDSGREMRRLYKKKKSDALWSAQTDPSTGVTSWVDLESGTVVDIKPEEGTILADRDFKSLSSAGRSKPELEKIQLFNDEDKEEVGGFDILSIQLVLLTCCNLRAWTRAS
jgi:hypothetical protein